MWRSLMTSGVRQGLSSPCQRLSPPRLLRTRRLGLSPTDQPPELRAYSPRRLGLLSRGRTRALRQPGSRFRRQTQALRQPDPQCRGPAHMPRRLVPRFPGQTQVPRSADRFFRPARRLDPCLTHRSVPPTRRLRQSQAVHRPPPGGPRLHRVLSPRRTAIRASQRSRNSQNIATYRNARVSARQQEVPCVGNPLKAFA